MEGDLLYPKRKKLEHNLPKQLAQPLQESEQGRLKTMAGLTPYLTPGHSPGHVIYYHQQDRVLLAGDLFTSKKGRLHPPMFTPHMDIAVRSSFVVEELKPKRLEVCHGESVLHPVDQLRDVQKMEKKLS